jgi:hypothetical protein
VRRQGLARDWPGETRYTTLAGARKAQTTTSWPATLVMRVGTYSPIRSAARQARDPGVRRSPHARQRLWAAGGSHWQPAGRPIPPPEASGGQDDCLQLQHPRRCARAGRRGQAHAAAAPAALASVVAQHAWAAAGSVGSHESNTVCHPVLGGRASQELRPFLAHAPNGAPGLGRSTTGVKLAPQASLLTSHASCVGGLTRSSEQACPSAHASANSIPTRAELCVPFNGEPRPLPRVPAA